MALPNTHKYIILKSKWKKPAWRNTQPKMPTGFHPSNPVSQAEARRNVLEKQTGLLGLSNSAWGVIGIVVLVVGALGFLALILLAFGLDIGPDIF